jgi:hypothetical protein
MKQIIKFFDVPFIPVDATQNLISFSRYQQRGGYTSLDDPGLLLRIQQPHILRSLSVMNVCDLPLGKSHDCVRSPKLHGITFQKS